MLTTYKEFDHSVNLHLIMIYLFKITNKYIYTPWFKKLMKSSRFQTKNNHKTRLKKSLYNITYKPITFKGNFRNFILFFKTMPKYIIGLKIKFKIRAVGHNFFKAINFDWSIFIFTWPIIITTSIKKVTFSTLKKIMKN